MIDLIRYLAMGGTVLGLGILLVLHVVLPSRISSRSVALGFFAIAIVEGAVFALIPRPQNLRPIGVVMVVIAIAGIIRYTRRTKPSSVDRTN